MPVSLHPLFPDQPGSRLIGVGRDTGVVERLRAEYRLARAHGDRLAKEFYQRLFERYPRFQALFSTEPAAQRARLMESLDTVIAFLDRPQEQARYLAQMGARHVRYGVLPEHYPIVSRLLAESVVAVLDDNAAPGTFDDWHEAFTLVSDQMIAGTRQP